MQGTAQVRTLTMLVFAENLDCCVVISQEALARRHGKWRCSSAHVSAALLHLLCLCRHNLHFAISMICSQISRSGNRPKMQLHAFSLCPRTRCGRNLDASGCSRRPQPFRSLDQICQLGRHLVCPVDIAITRAPAHQSPVVLDAA